jgi:hypothetical protein
MTDYDYKLPQYLVQKNMDHFILKKYKFLSYPNKPNLSISILAIVHNSMS